MVYTVAETPMEERAACYITYASQLQQLLLAIFCTRSNSKRSACLTLPTKTFCSIRQ
jgi:hypothetical protein